LPWIVDARKAGVADEGHALTSAQPRHHLRRAGGLVVPVVAEETPRDAVTVEQDPRPTRVLAEDDVRRPQLLEHPQGYVVEVSDRGRADGEHQLKSASMSLLIRSGREGSRTCISSRCARPGYALARMRRAASSRSYSVQ